jgi:hypothetical protein
MLFAVWLNRAGSQPIEPSVHELTQTDFLEAFVPAVAKHWKNSTGGEIGHAERIETSFIFGRSRRGDRDSNVGVGLRFRMGRTKANPTRLTAFPRAPKSSR